MAPRGTERHEHPAAWFQQSPHLLQDCGRIGEMLEAIDAQDDVDRLVPGFCERAAVGDARGLRARRRHLQPFRPDVDTDHAMRAALGHLDSFDSGPAAEVEDRQADDFLPHLWSHQDLELAATGIDNRLIWKLADLQARERVQHRRPNRRDFVCHGRSNLQSARPPRLMS